MGQSNSATLSQDVVSEEIIERTRNDVNVEKNPMIVPDDDSSEASSVEEELKEKKSSHENNEGDDIIVVTSDLEETSISSETSSVKDKKEHVFVDAKFVSSEYLETKLSGKIITKEIITNTILDNPNELDLYAESQIDSSSCTSKHYKEKINAYTRIALMILKMSKLLRDLRFKLVPAKTSEGKFWGAVFHLLDIQVIIHDAATADNEVVAGEKTCSGDSPTKEMVHPSSQKITNTLTDETEACPETLRSQCYIETLSVEDLRAILKQKDNDILQLRNQLTQSSSENHSTSNHVERSKSHKGKWIKNQDSIDFLELDEEIKRNLRGEKQKRLTEVREQMKFILDSDDLHCTSGNWDCCDKTNYDTECFS